MLGVVHWKMKEFLLKTTKTSQFMITNNLVFRPNVPNFTHWHIRVGTEVVSLLRRRVGMLYKTHTLVLDFLSEVARYNANLANYNKE